MVCVSILFPEVFNYWFQCLVWQFIMMTIQNRFHAWYIFSRLSRYGVPHIFGSTEPWWWTLAERPKIHTGNTNTKKSRKSGQSPSKSIPEHLEFWETKKLELAHEIKELSLGQAIDVLEENEWKLFFQQVGEVCNLVYYSSPKPCKS